MTERGGTAQKDPCLWAWESHSANVGCQVQDGASRTVMPGPYAD